MDAKKLLLFVVVIFGRGYIIAQSPQPQKFLPVMAPSSPEAAAFNRYGNYQVNLFTGIPEISIPLYEIKIGELRIPISLSYHSSGIKVTDVASRAGLGWDLQAGGSITRKIMGKPDELPGNYLSATPTSANHVRTQSEINPLIQDGIDYLSLVDQGSYDVEPDIFSYSFPGHSGKFLFNQKNNFAPVLIPYTPVAINKTYSPSNLKLGITDESGIVYKFDSTEWTSTGSGISTSCTSAWLLSDMISANKQDSIHFRYNTRSGGGITDSYFSDFLVLDDNCTGSYTGNPVGQYNSDNGTVATWWQQLMQIEYKNGKIVFESAPESRLDYSSQYQLQNRINAIKIYSFDVISKQYTLIRTIKFFHSYFINGTDVATQRLRLDSLQILTGTGVSIETYKFNYNTSIALPSNLSKMKDYWGYFNNVNNLSPSGNPTAIPKMQFQYLSQSNPPATIWVGGDHTNARDSDPAYMQAYILQKITFPTGGNTQFEYETNQYLDGQGIPKYAGGLRIKSIKSYTDATATPQVKTYKYGLNESGFGRNNFLLEDHFFMSAQNIRKKDDMVPALPSGTMCSGIANTKRTTTFFSNPTNDLESFDGAPVVYPFVTEYIGDGTVNAGKTTYAFSDKTDVTQNVGYKSPILTSYHFVRGLLTKRMDYRVNPENTYSLVSENRKKYQYFPFQSTSGSIGLVVFRTLITEGWAGVYYYTGCQWWTDSYSYLYYNYNIVSGDNKLVADTTISYDQNDSFKFNSVITTYAYDDTAHLQTSQIQTTNSKNETIASSFTYPYNYASLPYTTMTANHIFDKVITDTKTNNGNPLTLQTNNYASYTGNNFLISNIQLQVKSNTAETRASFNQYDSRGNILEMQKTQDIKQSFIWDYQSLLVIAAVTNSGQSDIAYTSFEADGKGNWTYTGSVSLDPTAPTGNRIYTLGTSITKSGLNASATYIVSYWKKGGTVAVNSTAAVAGRSVNGWTYYEHKVINPAGGTITVSGTNGVIDELRLYPFNAQMNTYTYSPLIGVTSQCDANNRLVYYEYDRFNRLVLVRDQDKNILKQVCYNYAGQPENCGIYYNLVQSGVYTKTGCTGCLVGTAVTYTVPAQTYIGSTQAEADQLAIDDVVANGQAYADANGTCTTPASAPLTGTNGRPQTHTVRFHNNCTGTDYNFTLNPNVTNVAMGTVPAGNYNVIFNPPAGTGIYTYRINGYMLHANSGTIYNVAISTGGNQVIITP